MKLCGVAIALGILGFCCSGSLAVDCTRKASIDSALRQCFRTYGLEMNVDSDQVHSAVQNDPQAACRNEQNYKRATRCALDVSKRCVVELGQSPSLLPDADAVVRGITYLCSNIDNIDAQCVKDKGDAMKNCARRKAITAFVGNTNLDPTRVTCIVFDITAQCMDEELASCPLQTKDIYVRLTRDYLTPTDCRNGTTPTPVHHYTTLAPMTTVAPLTTFQLVTWVPLTNHVSCYTQSSIQESQKRCFEQEGITVELPTFHTVDGSSGKQSYLDAIMANNKDFHTVCRQLPQYQRAMGCAVDVARQCLPADYKDYAPGSRQVQMMLRELCDNVDDINQQCVRSKASDLFDCGYNYGKTIRSRDVKTILCLAYKYNAMCLQKVLPSCGYRTAHLYVEIAKKYLNAPACPAIEIAQSGVATHSVASVGLLAVAAPLARLIRM